MADDSNPLAADDPTQGNGNPLAAASLVPSNYADVIAGHESGGSATAQNPYFPVTRGGPMGPHQFIASTWQDFAKSNPHLFGGMTPEEVLAARSDPALSAKATQWYAGVNAPVLQAAGVPPTPVNLAISHALGGQGAAGVLKYPDSTPLRRALLESQPKAADAILAQNPGYGNMTIGDLKARYGGLGGQSSGAQVAPQTAMAAPVVAAPAPPPINAMSSLAPFSGASMAAMTPYQRLAMMRQLQSLFAPQHAAQTAQAGGGGQMVGGVDANIPLSAGRVA
jgi:hypothetical protein